ncbi:MAG: LysR family transcriptional regulator [Eubacteriales bacterium]|nr:LysR family transcriptional regulator [Eubacteriales bacterium]
MDLKTLESFIIVAEQSSFTKASEILGYSQSAISTQIKQLEKRFGTPLFERVNHTVKLTSKGHEILNLAHQMLLLSKEMHKVAQNEEKFTGRIRIAMAESLCHYLFGEQYAAFHQEYPGIVLKIISAETEEMFEMAKKNEVDMIYTLDKHLFAGNFNIVEDKVAKTHFVVAADHPLASSDKVTLQDLTNYPMILTEKGMSYRNLLEEQFSKSHLQLNPFLEIGDTSLICNLVSKNMGISFLPDYVTKEYVNHGLIKRIHVKDLELEVYVQLLYHKDKFCSPEMQCVIDFLTGLRF